MGFVGMAISIVAESGEFEAAIAEAGKALDGFSDKMGGKTTESANKMSKSIGDAMGKVGEAINATMSKLASGDMGASNATEALAAGLSKLTGIDLGPAVELTNKIKENLLAMENLSRVTGVTAGTFTEIKDAMEEAGIPSGKLSQNFLTLREAVGKVQSGSEDTRKAFEALGISTEGWNQKTPNTISLAMQLADRFHSGKMSAMDLSNAHTLLGEGFESLIGYMQRGSRAIAADEAAHKAHGHAVDESIESAKELQREEAALAEKLQELLLPAFRFVVAVVQQVVAAFISLKGILINVGNLLSGVAHITADSFNAVTTILGSVAAHWKDILKGNFSAIKADAQGAFKQIETDFTNTMVNMVQTANQTDKELDAFFNHQSVSAEQSDNKRTSIVRSGARQREVISLQSHQNMVKTDKEVALDWEQMMKLMTQDTKTQGNVISGLLADIPKKLPPALAKANTQTRQLMQSISQNIANSFTTAIHGMISGTETLTTAFKKMGQQMLSSLESVLEKMLSQWLQHHIMELLIHTQTKQEEVGVEEAASAEKQTISMRDHMQQVLMLAKQTAISAWNALSKIPVIGPALGAAAAASTFAAVMAFGSITSAAGGFYEVDRDQLAMIHKNEMVLPAGIAERLRSTIDGSGGMSGSGVSVNVYHNVNAIDAASFKDTIKQHSNIIGNEVVRVLKKKGITQGG